MGCCRRAEVTLCGTASPPNVMAGGVRTSAECFGKWFDTGLRQVRDCDVQANSAHPWLSGGQPLNVGRVPAARGRAVALRVEPLSKAQRLAPSGCHPSRGLAATLRARWRAGWRRTAARGAWPVRSPMQRSRLRLHRDAEQPSQAGAAGGDDDSGPFPCPRIAGLASFTGT